MKCFNYFFEGHFLMSEGFERCFADTLQQLAKGGIAR